MDDSPTQTIGIQQIVTRFAYVTMINATSGPELYDAASASTPDIVLLGPARLPADAPTTLARLQELARGTRVIAFGRTLRPLMNPANISAGLHGFLPDGATPQDFDRAFSAALAGFTYFPRGMTEELSGLRVHFPQLTAREQEVLELLSEGLSNQRIARVLGLKETTVKMYVTSVLAKLQVENRLQACLKARGLYPVAA
ncbi:LuxR C-terminal-related transcriptional regulator [Streptomyces sp. CBMA291]|uniref:LuxR C-terminal-related transcriptional regulator n=2 Tax=unclassified Streptomyces TaxID=2593676 RepID=UPI00166031FE|nr:response regulator transcription factor [Streptomyces sp. CBMA291]